MRFVIKVTILNHPTPKNWCFTRSRTNRYLAAKQFTYVEDLADADRYDKTGADLALAIIQPLLGGPNWKIEAVAIDD